MKRVIAVVLASAALSWAVAVGASEPAQPAQSGSAYSTTSSYAVDDSASKIAGYDAVSAQIESVLQIKPVVSDQACDGNPPDCDGNGVVCCDGRYICCGTACPAC
jgi:hypothetical protein